MDKPRNRARETRAERTRNRDIKALSLRAAGLDYDTIARQLGMANRSVAWKAVQRALNEQKREAAAQVLDLELTRLDQMTPRVYSAAVQGDLRAIDRVLKIMERRAKLLNLDNPSTDQRAQEGMNLLQALATQLAATPDTYTPAEAPDVDN